MGLGSRPGSVVAVTALVVVPAAGTNALARWLLPWRPTGRYTFVQLNKLPTQIVVPYAEPFLVGTDLAVGSKWNPDSGRARYGRQDPVYAPQEHSRFVFSLPPQKEADALTITVGDAKQKIQVAPTARPELTEITAGIELPDYLQYGSTPKQDVRSGSLSVVNGSHVALSAVATAN